METKNNIPTFYPHTRTEWRQWLKENHSTASSVWLIRYHKKSGKPTISYEESVEEALCFGWIDGQADKRDHESSYQYFAPRKAKSYWSKLNRERVDRLLKQDLITPNGQALIDQAKTTGTWDAFADVDQLLVPDDLQKLFDANPTALAHYQNFPPSAKRMILEWIKMAKKPETRQRRLGQTVELAAQGKRARP